MSRMMRAVFCIAGMLGTHGACAGGIATQVAAGYSATCALTSDGAAWCWGYNGRGEVGDGTAGNTRPLAVAVSGLGGGVHQLSAGFTHVCALTTAGAVKCWGANNYGQLGDGSTVDRPSPVDVVGLGSGVTAIAAGGFHTCALLVDGSARCWGYNSSGQLGDGSTQNRVTPVAVDAGALGGAAFAALAGGGEHTCAIDGGGGAYCWGANAQGQLGNGTTVGAHAPVAVSASAMRRRSPQVARTRAR